MAVLVKPVCILLIVFAVFGVHGTTLSARSLLPESAEEVPTDNPVLSTRQSPTHHIKCNKVKSLFLVKNVAAESEIPNSPVHGGNLSVCEARQTCCTPEMEDNIQMIVSRDFQMIIQQTSGSLKGLLFTNAAQVQESVREMISMSENNTLVLFNQQYKRLSVQARAHITALYSSLTAYMEGKNAGSANDPNLEEAVKDFFNKLFPLVYHHALNPKLKDFSHDYKECLESTQREIRPFGEIPRQLAASISQSFEATRSLVEGMQLGIEVLNTTDHFRYSSQCYSALSKMSYCSKCQGFANAKPCNGYCMNVVRGCLAFVAEIDQPWNDYVDAVERLLASLKTSLNIEEVISSMDERISAAIMYSMENGPQVETKVKRKCGHPRRNTRDTEALGSLEPEARGHIVSVRSTEASDLLSRLQTFLSSLLQSKGFYANLADLLCLDDDFSAKGEANCWNGQQMGEYTKTIVGVGMTTQKYNPELKVQRTKDLKVAQLSDKLRHIRQILLGRITLFPESESYMMKQEGSGSGWGYNTHFDGHHDDDDDDDDNFGNDANVPYDFYANWDREEGSGSYGSGYGLGTSWRDHTHASGFGKLQPNEETVPSPTRFPDNQKVRKEDPDLNFGDEDTTEDWTSSVKDGGVSVIPSAVLSLLSIGFILGVWLNG